MLSKRLQKASEGSSFLLDALAKQRKNAYHAQSNPGGVINLGTAENKISFKIMQERFENIKDMPEEYAHYGNFSGNNQFRDRLARLVNHYMTPSIEISRENIFVTNGCGPAIETLAFSLCDENEAVLTPAPYYGAFGTNMRQRTSVNVYPVNLSCHKYKLQVDDLEQALIRANNDGIKIKALILSNPYNPIGKIFTISELESYAEFCYNNDLHFISDEIYFFSAYDQQNEMNSVLAIPNFERYKNIIHVIWGFSKDFGLSGFRTGMILTYNDQLQSALKGINLYTSIPTCTQYVLENLINDFDWLDEFLLVYRLRLRRGLSIVTETLDALGIPYVKPSGGLFIWVNLNKYLERSTEGDERGLFSRLLENGVYMAPGFAFGSPQKGWFRIIFSIEKEELQVAMQRFKNTLTMVTLSNDLHTVSIKVDTYTERKICKADTYYLPKVTQTSRIRQK